MDTQSTTSMTQSLTAQVSALWDTAIAGASEAAHGLVIGWNSMPEISRWTVAGAGILLILLAIRRTLRMRKLLRVNRAMAATLDDPFWKTVTLKDPNDYYKV